MTDDERRSGGTNVGAEAGPHAGDAEVAAEMMMEEEAARCFAGVVLEEEDGDEEEGAPASASLSAETRALEAAPASRGCPSAPAPSPASQQARAARDRGAYRARRQDQGGDQDQEGQDRRADAIECDRALAQSRALEEEILHLRAVHGPRHPRVAEALTTAALFHQHVRTDLDAALALHRQALGVYRTAAKAAESSSSSSAAKESSEAPKAPKTSAAERDKGEGDKDDREDGRGQGRQSYEIEIAIALTDIGDVHRCRGSTVEALGAYREALSIFRGGGDDNAGGGKGRGRGRGAEGTATTTTQPSSRTSSSSPPPPSGMRTSANHPGVRAAERGLKLLEGRY